MTKEYRGRHEIIEQVLRTAINNGSEGVSRTSIMYKSFLSHGQLKEYLSYTCQILQNHQNKTVIMTVMANENKMMTVTIKMMVTITISYILLPPREGPRLNGKSRSERPKKDDGRIICSVQICITLK
jgi:hypothetical protein